MDDEERPGPPPLTEEVVRDPSPIAFESPGRTDTEGIELDRSSFTAPGPTVKKAPPPPSAPPHEVGEPVASQVGRLLGSGVSLLLALLVCLLPAFWRERIERHMGDLPLRLAALITGIAEAAVMLIFGLDAMVSLMQAKLAECGPAMMDFVLKHDVSPQTMYEMHQVQGAALWFAFLISPVGLLLAFFALEGTARIVGATWGKEVLGTLPLWLLDRVRWLVTRLLARSRQKPLPADLIVKDEQGMLVSLQSACAYAWDHTTTLRFEGRLYVVEEHLSSEDRERPHGYRVREAPTGHIIRKLIEYAPTP